MQVLLTPDIGSSDQHVQSQNGNFMQFHLLLSSPMLAGNSA
jgi:hypothetical protein